MFSNGLEKCSLHYSCEICQYITNKKSNYDKHILTAKHSKAMVSNQKVAKSSSICISTIYETNNDNKQKFQKHNLKPEINEAMVSNGLGKSSQKSSHLKYNCNKCGKKYKDNTGLWRHKKVCKIIENEIKHDAEQNITEGSTDKELMMLLIKENSEFKTMMMKVLENGIYNNSNNTNNSNNKTFNLQVFLNETCKDAMNISDFMNSIQLQLSDLEDVGELGYVNGISNIIYIT
jgi:hypothetical protein